MLYLAQISYTVYEYMEVSKNEEAIRLVEANSEEEAEMKVKKHFEDKSEDFSKSYIVVGVGISEVIK